jgi:hypothetical protein
MTRHNRNGSTDLARTSSTTIQQAGHFVERFFVVLLLRDAHCQLYRSFLLSSQALKAVLHRTILYYLALISIRHLFYRKSSPLFFSDEKIAPSRK